MQTFSTLKVISTHLWCLEHNIQACLRSNSYGEFGLVMNIFHLFHFDSIFQSYLWNVIRHSEKWIVKLVLNIVHCFSDIEEIVETALPVCVMLHAFWKFVPSQLQAQGRFLSHNTSFSNDLCLILFAFNTPCKLGLQKRSQQNLKFSCFCWISYSSELLRDFTVPSACGCSAKHHQRTFSSGQSLPGWRKWSAVWKLLCPGKLQSGIPEPCGRLSQHGREWSWQVWQHWQGTWPKSTKHELHL